MLNLGQQRPNNYSKQTKWHKLQAENKKFRSLELIYMFFPRCSPSFYLSFYVLAALRRVFVTVGGHQVGIITEMKCLSKDVSSTEIA